MIKSSHIDLDVPYVVSGRSFVVSDTEEIVGSVLVPNTAPEEAKTKRGGDCGDDFEEEEEVVEGRERRTASRRFIVPRTFVRIPEIERK